MGSRRRRRALTALAATGTASVAVGAVVLGRELRRSGPRVLVARARRLRRVAWIGARRGVAFVRLGPRSRVSDEALDDFHVHSAGEAYELLGEMKGVAMKLGQMASLFADVLPPGYGEALRALQHAAPPMAPELVDEVVEAELGEPPERAFFEFSTEPVAAASIGQVHAARLFDGTPVAVKVQYPGVDVAIRADLDNAFVLTSLARAIAPGIEPGPLVDELRARILDELDYRKEADHQEEFRGYYEGHPWIRVPAVVRELSTRRVLVSQWASGSSFYELLERPDVDRDLVGEELFRFWCEAVFRLGFFNGDPHPGNYFFAPEADGPGGSRPIWFLDFGLVKRFRPEEVAVLRDQILALRSGDRERLRSVMVRDRWMKPDAPVDFDRVADLARLTNLAAIDHRPFTFTTDYVSELIQSSVMLTGPYGDVLRHLTLPPEQVLLNRIHLGLSALLARLGATRNWAAIMDEYLLDAPPATALGALGAGWPRSGRPAGP